MGRMESRTKQDMVESADKSSKQTGTGEYQEGILGINGTFNDRRRMGTTLPQRL
jgi:hypothetical protein